MNSEKYIGLDVHQATNRKQAQDDPRSGNNQREIEEGFKHRGLLSPDPLDQPFQCAFDGRGNLVRG